MSALLSPIILFFILGMAAGLFRSTLTLPRGLTEGLSIYLMLAIGFKGGVEMAHTTFTAATLITMGSALVSGLLIPVVAYGLLRNFTRVSRIDAAAIGAHYGSISVVTFIAATVYLLSMSIPYAGYIVAVVALMEIPAIVSGLLLAKGTLNLEVLKEVFLNGSVVLLIGSLMIGWITGDAGLALVAAFIGAPFKGVLCLFLLAMGLKAAKKLRGAKGIDARLIAFGLVMPFISGGLALLVSVLLGLGVGTAALLMTLCASASYIAVPAAMQVALPEANEAYSLTLALGVTFPLNVILGIPTWVAACSWLLG
jgi:hypothetical protein